MVLWGSKIGCQKEIKLHVQNMINVVGSLVNIIGGDLYENFNEYENLHFDNKFEL